MQFDNRNEMEKTDFVAEIGNATRKEEVFDERDSDVSFFGFAR